MDSDEENVDVRAPYDEDIVQELILDAKLKSIALFKTHASKESALYGIEKLSDCTIFEIIKTYKTHYCNIMTPYEIELFEDIFVTIYGFLGNTLIYNDIYTRLIKKVSM